MFLYFGFVTRLQLNASDDAFVRTHKKDWEPLDEDISFLKIDGSLGRTRYVFHSKKREWEALERYQKRAERDWDHMVELRNAVEKVVSRERNIGYPTAS